MTNIEIEKKAIRKYQREATFPHDQPAGATVKRKTVEVYNSRGILAAYTIKPRKVEQPQFCKLC
jgi:hypothetical protein